MRRGGMVMALSQICNAHKTLCLLCVSMTTTMEWQNQSKALRRWQHVLMKSKDGLRREELEVEEEEV